MLNRVSAALSRLIRPIATSVSTRTEASSPQQNPKFERHPSQKEKKKEAQEIPEKKTAEGAENNTALEGVSPGLSTSFLQILQKLHETRAKFRWRSGQKPYGGNRKKISTLKKGMVVDEEAG